MQPSLLRVRIGGCLGSHSTDMTRRVIPTSLKFAEEIVDAMAVTLTTSKEVDPHLSHHRCVPPLEHQQPRLLCQYGISRSQAHHIPLLLHCNRRKSTMHSIADFALLQITRRINAQQLHPSPEPHSSTHGRETSNTTETHSMEPA